MLAALDSSTRFAGVGLYDERGVRAELVWLAGQDHTVQLLPSLQRLLEMERAEVGSLRAVGVALGPGSFTGLRVAFSAAKGLCLALDIPFIGVGTLAATAYQQRLVGRQICALVDAGRGQLYGALYGSDEEDWQAEGRDGIAPLTDLLDRIHEPTVFCGELGEHAAAEIRGRLGARAIIATPASGLRRAGSLAELAWRRYVKGEADDLAQAQPLYLRRPQVGQ